MLVAGCGTGHHPVQVAQGLSRQRDSGRRSESGEPRLRHPDDAARSKFPTSTYRQGDILELGSLESTLRHHRMWRRAAPSRRPDGRMARTGDLLESDGLMNIALYSEKARVPFGPRGSSFESMHFPLTPEGIRRCRRAIVELPDGHPARSIVNFRTSSPLDEFRDLVMHVQEHQFTLPRIAECLDRLGMQFLRLECTTTTLNRFKAMFPKGDSEIEPRRVGSFRKRLPRYVQRECIRSGAAGSKVPRPPLPTPSPDCPSRPRLAAC